MHLYIRKAKSCKQEVSAENFAEWVAQLRCPNWIMSADFVLNVLHPVFLFRAGVRQCNDEIAKAGCLKLLESFLDSIIQNTGS